MPSPQRQILVTSALPYANGPIHLGHLVEYLQTDIWVRFQKMRGHECIYICASDAHGTPIMLRAQADGITPEELITRVHKEHERDFADFLIEFDNFYTTHSDENRELSGAIYSKLNEGGYIERRIITQAYDPEKEMFLPDRFIRGECPRCGTKDQYGDNCEACGATYSPTELINAVSAVNRDCRIGIFRATHLISVLKFRMRPVSIFMSGWMPRLAIWPASKTCVTKRNWISTISGKPIRLLSYTILSARTSPTSTAFSGRPCWMVRAIANRPMSLSTVS